MGIRHRQAPAPNFEVLKNYVTNIHLNPDDHSAHIPHKVYTIDLASLLAGKRFNGVNLVGWRYMFRGTDQQYQVIEIGVDEATNTHTFHHTNMGDHVDNLIALYDRAGDHPALKEKDYEINILRVPACYVLAVWFKGADHAHEFFVPLAPVHHNFEADRSYEADEFMDLLEQAAREMASYPAMHAHAAANVDDLTRIEGIGSQLAALLNSNGIATFAQLASSTTDQLQALLRHAGSRFNRADPTTWPEQAALAAASNWPDLERLQQQLKGGRK